MAPELCQESSYDYKVDVWAVGVITFILLSGQPPFYDRSSQGAFRKENIYSDIISPDSEPEYHKVHCSEEGKNFIKSCLQKNSSARANYEELLNHEWLSKFDDTEMVVG